MNKKIIAVALTAGLIFAGCQNQETTTKTESVATVDGEAISGKEYLKTMKTFSLFASARQDMKTPLVDMLVENKVIQKDLKKHNVEVTDKDIQDSIDSYQGSVGGKKNFEKMLTDYDLTMEDLKEYIKYEATAKKHMDWYDKEHKPSDKEINKYFDENKDYLVAVEAQHILVDTEEEAKKAKERIDKGEKFEDVAKELSKDEYTKDEGGKLGFIQKNQMDKGFGDVAFSLKEGEVSGPVKTSFGYHIIKVTKTRKNVEELKDQIIQVLNQDKYKEYLEKLKKDSKVEVEGKKKTEKDDDTLYEDKEEIEDIQKGSNE